MLEGQSCPNCLQFDEFWWFLHYCTWESPKLVHFGHLQKFALFSVKCSFFDRNGCRMAVYWLKTVYEETFRWCFISLFRQKGYNTWCSQAVSHPSTNQALRCYVVYLRWSDENRCIKRGMVVATDIWNNNALVLSCKMPGWEISGFFQETQVRRRQIGGLLILERPKVAL